MSIKTTMVGTFETGGNAQTPNRGGEIDWGDGGKADPLPVSGALNETRTHVYSEAGVYYPSARMTSDYKYDGNGSCSYRCDVRRAAVVVVYPARKAPHLHTVEKHDSLYELAGIYHTSWRDIYLANREQVKWPDAIFPGQTLLIASHLAPLSAKGILTKIGEAWNRVRGQNLHLERPDAEPISGENPSEGKLQDGLTNFGEWLRDRQLESQEERGREEAEKIAKEELDSGASGVVLLVGRYGDDGHQEVGVEFWGKGVTPVEAVADGLQPSLRALHGNLDLNADESFFSFYTLSGGKLAHRDLPRGWLTRGSADKIRAEAAKAARDRAIAKQISEQLKAAREKASKQNDLTRQFTEEQATAQLREASDEGPRSRPRAPSRGGGGGGGSRGGPDRQTPTGIPDSDRPTTNSSPAPKNNSRDGLPDPGNGVPIGTPEHPTIHDGPRNDPGNGVPIGTPEHPTIHDGGGDNSSVNIHPSVGSTADSVRAVHLLKINLSGIAARNSLLASNPVGHFPVPEFAMSQPRLELTSYQIPTTTADTTDSSSDGPPRGLTTPLMSSPSWWGVARSRRWIDLNQDGFPDFCRVVVQPRRANLLVCTMAKGSDPQSQYSGVTFAYEERAGGPRLLNGRWIAANLAGKFEFCGLVESRPQLAHISCIAFGANGFGIERHTTQRVNLGLPDGRVWVDFNGDGLIDFCTLIQKRPGYGQLGCTLGTPDGFQAGPILSKNIHWRSASRRQWIVNAGGHVNFCTVAGKSSEFVDCTSSQGDGFGETARDLLDHNSGVLTSPAAP